ncbi:MAG: NosD domain-containing protein, partial [Candidatus Krumholzibacteria bacterium]|nr:NosD domain-containing protein [Candidatus Krumholzibacteria bacterium]
FTLGAGNTIGGPGLENSWPLAIGMGSFPAAATVIPAAGNTNNDIQVAGGTSTRSGLWRKFSGLDYIVTTNGTVDTGGTLILEPGLTVRLDPSRHLVFRGQLDAIGAAGQEIVFTRNGASNWGYLQFQTGGSGNFDHCLVEYCTYAAFGNSNGAISVTNSTLQNCTYGVYSVADNALTVTDCVVQNNTHGVWAQGGTVDLGSTAFVANATSGFQGTGVAPGLLDTGNVFTDNGTGLRVDDVAGLNLTTAMTFTGSTVAGIHLDNCDGATVDNQTLTGNAGAKGALFIDDCGEFTLGAGNTIGGAGLENSWPLAIGMGSFPAAATVIPAAGNTNNDIQVAGGISSRSGLWRKFNGLDYVVAVNGTVDTGGTLTLEPGLTVRLDPSRRLIFRGQLDAIGAAGQEIVFTRNGASNWGYLQFQVGGSGNFDHCLVEYCTYAVFGNSNGAISVTNSTLQNCTYGVYSIADNALSVTDCVVQNNTHGVWAQGGTVDLGSTAFVANATSGFQGTGVAPNLLDSGVTFADNGTGLRVNGVPGVNLITAMTITGSTVAGIHLDNCEASSVDNQVLTGNAGTRGALFVADSGEFTLGAGNTIGGAGLENSWPLAISAGTYPAAASVIPTTGNTNNDIQVAGGTSDRSGTWRKFAGLDYVVTVNTMINTGGELIIEPAVTLRFDNSRRLIVRGNLVAVGSAGQEIVFTRNGTGPWGYLYFQTDGSGTLDHCRVEHASNGIYGNSTAAIDVTNTTVQNCTYGVYCVGNNSIALTDCLIEANSYGVNATSGNISFLRTRVINNATYGVYLQGATPTFGNTLAEWNDIYGNGSGLAGRDLRNYLTDIEAKFVHWGTMDHGDVLDQTYDFHDNKDFGYITVLPFINSQHDTETTAVDDGPVSGAVPMAFGLHQNAPNPFNPSTVIRFDLAAAMPVQLRIYDVSGAVVATLLDEQVSAGYHQAVWSGNDDQGRAVASGLYFYRIRAGENLETRPMMLVK